MKPPPPTDNRSWCMGWMLGLCVGITVLNLMPFGWRHAVLLIAAVGILALLAVQLLDNRRRKRPQSHVITWSEGGVIKRGRVIEE